MKQILTRSVLALAIGVATESICAAQSNGVVRIGKHVYALHIPPVSNAPFSASEDLEMRQVLPDGTSVAQRMLLHVGRDASGRTHQESGYFQAESNTGETRLKDIVLFDPTTGIRTTIDPYARTASQGIAPRKEKSEPRQNESQQDLGIEILDGESVHHTVSTRTIAVSAEGNDRPIIVTDEVWRSTDLAVNVMMRHGDPLNGTVTMKLLEIRRGDPAPELFEIPSDYQILTVAIGRQ